MAFPGEKTMFEIYREADFNTLYRVVYYTELSEHNKEFEINRAMAGEQFLNGFISDGQKEGAKRMISELLSRLNAGEPLSLVDARLLLEPFLVD